MSQLKNYTGSVYGGLGHLLKAYCETKNIEIPEQLQQVQNLERFDYVIWRDLLEDLNRLNPKTGLGLEIAEHVQPKHLGIIAYLALRFEWRFAVAAIIANMHDVIIILGFFAFFQWEFNLTVLAAILAVLGYSVNESVVVFDRVRENFKKMRKANVVEVIDNAITRTMSRTVITHLMTQTMVCSMLFFGGETLHNFALALTIGILFGIYSSVLVACPVAMWLGVSQRNLVPDQPKEDTSQEINP